MNRKKKYLGASLKAPRRNTKILFANIWKCIQKLMKKKSSTATLKTTYAEKMFNETFNSFSFSF
jgi:hypothetical protein